MVNHTIVLFIQEQLKKGYTINAIREHLIKYYPTKDVDEAINYIYHPSVHHVIHFSHTTVVAIILIITAVAVLSFSAYVFFGRNDSSNTLLDLNLEEVKMNARPGEEILFLTEITNMGSNKRYDVNLRHEIISINTGNILTFKEETRGIETLGSSKTKIIIPSNAELGNYILKTTASYDGKIASAALAVKVYKEEEKPTCTDNIQNQGEEGVDCGGPCPKCVSCFNGIKDGFETGVDCGGPCKKCEGCPSSCDDNNMCTKDVCDESTNFKCVNTIISPCCGNGICESEENNQNCAEDCKVEIQKDEFSSLSLFDRLEKIKGVAEYDADKASEHCSKIDLENYKNQCYLNVAEVSSSDSFCSAITSERMVYKCYSTIARKNKDYEICNKIEKDESRDSCYMNFVVEGDYSVCDNLVNEYLKKSCIALRDAQE